MSTRGVTIVLFAVVGAVAREVGIALLTAADIFDPPIVSPQERAERDEMYVPEAWSVTW